MGVFLTPSDSVARLVTCFQEGRQIEEYVAEFLELSHGASWADDTLKTVFWHGLDDHLHQQAPASVILGTFELYLDHVLWLSGSAFTMGEADDDIATQPLTICICSRVRACY